MKTGTLRVLHLIPSLETGGAEMSLVRLITGTPPTHGVEHIVVLFRPEGLLREELLTRGHTVLDLGADSPARLRKIIRFFRLVRRLRPDVVQGWMPHAALIAAICGRILGIPSIASLRIDADRRVTTTQTWYTLRALCGPLQRVPSVFVACSDSVAQSHRALGLKTRIVVIENGTPTGLPTNSARAAARDLFGIREGTFVIGRAGRWDPGKDHPTLLKALSLLDPTLDVAVLFAGRGMTGDNTDLNTVVEATLTRPRVYLVGEQSDMQLFYAACDVVCSSSIAEGFPNVVAEALGAGVPVIATRVAATEQIVGATGWLVEPGQAHELAAAIGDAIRQPPEALRLRGLTGLRRVESEFGLGKMVSRYQALYQELSQPSTPDVDG